MLVFPAHWYCRIYNDGYLLLEGAVLYAGLLYSSQKIQLKVYVHCITFIDGITTFLAEEPASKDLLIHPPGSTLYGVCLSWMEVISQVY